MAGIELKNVEKLYPNGYKAVKSIDLKIEDEEFMVLVGPSGCGKTTTLRMIAGLEDISSGELYIGDKKMNEVDPRDRNIAFVFQNYALYPHMSVYDNMAFGLKLQKVPKDEIKDRIEKAAEILDIETQLKKKPKELSGGQRQRVALGRAIVRNPSVFLMDEPLSNLDAKLRVQMRAELIKLHNDLKTTFVYVTHDQTEAMTMGTRICVMKDGLIQQLASPTEIYNQPKNLFVAGFIGSPQMNFMTGTLSKEPVPTLHIDNEDSREFKLDISNVIAKNPRLSDYYDQEVTVGIRPEHLLLTNGEGIRAQVLVTELLGSESHIHFHVQGNLCTIKTEVHNDIKIRDWIDISMKPDQLHFFDPKTEERI